MNKTDLLRQIAQAISKAAKKVDPKVKINGAKSISALSAAKLADDLILDKIPGLKSAMVWTDNKITEGQQWLVDNTLGKIPGVGPVISKLHKAGTDARHKLRDALFGKNDPQWYEHLPQHVTFSIPGGYNNKVVKFKTNNGGNVTIPSVATIRFVRNLVTTPYATNSRYSEIYTAVKYARGLSYLPYTVNQLAIMFEIGNELAVLYYRTSKAVSAAFHYSLTKANLPNAILNGLNMNDIIEHYADYCTLLDQMYNYMSVNVPLLPIMHKKLRQMCLFTALDSDKPAMSTYLQACVYSNHIGITEDGEGFYSNYVNLPHTISDCRNTFIDYMNLLSSGTGATSQLLNVIADVKGSISSVEYVDNWRGIKFEDTFTQDTLFLNSIKNIDLLPTVGLVGSLQATDFGYVCDNFVSAWQGSSSHPIKVSNSTPQSIIVRMGSASKGDTNLSPTYVCCSGSKDILPFAKNIASQTTPYSFDLTSPEYYTPNKLVSLDGNENSEGKVLETISLGSIVRKIEIEAPSANTPCYANIHVDPSLFVAIQIIVANGYEDGETVSLQNILQIPGWTVDNIIFNAMTTWTMVDWMPCMLITKFASAATYYSGHLWDINGIGSLSRTAVETSIDYITYSLLYPGNVEALNKVELANKLISSLKTK